VRPPRPAPARLLVALLLSALLGLSACGGQEIQADEVPGPPADLPLPQGEPPAAEGTEAPTPTPTPTPEAGATEEGGASAAPAPQPDAAADAGAAAGEPATEADAPGNDQPPPAGSEAERFEEFCSANPGAC